MSTMYFCEAMYLFVGMFNSATALSFLLIYLHLHSFPVCEEDEYKHWQSAETKGESVASWKPEYFFPRGL